MCQTAAFRRQHDEILAIAAELTSYLGDRQRLQDESRDVRRILSTMVGKLSAHLAMEDRSLYPRMVGSKDTQVRMTAKRFQFEMGGIGEAIFAYGSKWRADAIADDPAGFSRATSRLLAALDKRIQTENGQLFPLLDKAA